MKINAKKLAISLYEITNGQSEAEINKVTKRLVEFLAKNGSLNLLNKLASDYRDHYNKMENVLDVTITTARELSSAQKENFAAKLNSVFKKKISANFKQDESLIGGFLIRTPDYLLDGSISHNLESLKK